MLLRKLLLLTMLDLVLLCTLNNLGCMTCTRVGNGIELLCIRVVHGWMRASPLAVRCRSEWLYNG